MRRGVADDDGNLGLFRVGRVLEAGKHPNADRLQLCQVDVGEGEPARSSAAPGTSAPARRSRSPSPAQSCRTASSSSSASPRRAHDGMILAEDEVELGTDHTGIMVLPRRARAGNAAADVLPLTDEFLARVEPNRPDLLAIYGMAREVAALYDVDLSPPPGIDPSAGATSWSTFRSRTSKALLATSGISSATSPSGRRRSG